MALWMIIPVAACIGTLIWGLWVAAGDVLARMNASQFDAQDGFTPSMRRWGYVGLRRGQ